MKLLDQDGYRRCTGISDNDVMEMAREALDRIKTPIRAMRNKAIVWVAPFRKEGAIEVPWDFRDNSVEAVMVDDGTPMGIPKGTVLMIRPDEGIVHEVDGVELCFIPGSAIMLLQE